MSIRDQDYGSMDIHGEGFIDHIALVADPRNYAQRMLVRRTYDTVRESLDIKTDEPWAQWRKLLNGCQV